MIKLITPGSQDFGEAVAKLVKLSHDGMRGSDLRDFIKRAGHPFADAVKGIKFNKGEVPIHLLALGATELYGPNRNGDGFKSAALRKYHDTFVKHARWYRNHKNKDKSKSYGVIKLAMFNEPMQRVELIVALNGTKEAAEHNGGLVADEELNDLDNNREISGSMACASAGTLVKVRRRFKKIEDIKPGDEVLTHLGNYKTVRAIMPRIKQQYAQIKVKCCGRQVLEFTPDHEFYVARWQDTARGKLGLGKDKKDKTGYNRGFRKKNRSILYKNAKWLPCGELKCGDLLLMPIPKPTGVSNLTIRDARMLGYYLSEGSINKNAVVYTCNKQDALVDEIEQLFNPDIFHIGYYNHSASKEAYNLTINSKTDSSLCISEVGKRIENKVIPEAVYNASREIKLAFLAAWFNGDGWQDKNGLHWSTKEKTLSIELQMLLASIGIAASVCRIDHASDLPNCVKREVPGIEYVVNVSNKHSSDFVDISKAKEWTLQTEETYVFITGNYLAVPVESVTLVDEEVEVYDISVKDDESFTAFGLAVHNCKVAYDVCSVCGNKAKNRSEYCKSASEGGNCPGGGLTNNICTVLANGHIVHADNPHPDFFDYSKVGRGADRTSFVFGKVASGHIKSGADLAYEFNVTAPYDILANDMEPSIALQFKCAHILADAEKSIENNPLKIASYLLAFDKSVQTPIPSLESYTKKEASKLLNAFAGQKIALSLREFVRLVTGNSVEKSASIAAEVSRCMPGIFNRLIANDNLESMLASNSFCASKELAPLQYRTLAVKLANDYSLEQEYVGRRVLRSALRGTKSPAFVKSAGDIQNADRKITSLSEQYGLYKIGLLSDILNNCLDPQLTADLLVGQNLVN